MPTKATPLDIDFKLGGLGDQISQLKNDPALATKSLLNKINFDEKLSTFM